MQIIADRRALHQIPEIQWELPKTAQYLKNSLQKLSCEVLTPVGDAVCAWFDFGAEKTLAFRSDMDALPVAEQTGLSFASTHPGMMHACGHDGHMAMLLELARQIDKLTSLDRNILLIFQPAEESPGGAKILCDTGILENYKVEAIFGMHLWPELEPGKAHSCKGPMMACASEVTVEITGKSSHIGRADRGIDATAAAVAFYNGAAELERSVPEGVYRLLKFGKFSSGTARNAIAAHARLEGTLRVFDDALFDQLRKGLYDLAEAVEKSTGAKVSVHLREGYPVVNNPEDLYDKVAALAPILPIGKPSMVAEDFSWYQRHVPGILFFLGVGNTPSLHATNFDFDESVLQEGADFFLHLAKNFR